MLPLQAVSEKLDGLFWQKPLAIICQTHNLVEAFQKILNILIVVLQGRKWNLRTDADDASRGGPDCGL